MILNNLSAFIFTNYNNSIYTVEVVKSIYLNRHKSKFDIVIIDNNSNKKSKDILIDLKSQFPKLIIVFLKNNLGYFNGLNEGIRSLPSNTSLYDFVLIGNNDLYFENNFIASVYKHYNLFKNFPIVSPNIISLDGFHQNPHVIKNPSKFREIMYDLYFTNFYLSRLILFIAKKTKKFSARGDEKHHEVSQEIIQGYGACYLLGPLFFKIFKKLFAPTFLMGEEFFLYHQLSEKNYKIFYESEIFVNHHDHATVSKLPSREFWNLSKESHKIYRQFVKI
jgi:GT2 family glycosyltransferase